MKKLLLLLLLLVSFGSFAQSVSSVIYPLYVQGVGSSNASDDRKVPFACRMAVAGLTPNTTYRYYPRFVQDTTLATNGQGNPIIVSQTGNFIRVTSVSLATLGRYGEFTTDATGNYTGWFVIEPNLAIEYQPGNVLYFRLMLNNGAGGGSVALRLTAPQSVTVKGWGSSPNQITGIRAAANAAYSARNFMMLYDNIAGTGRPVSGTYVESDGTNNDAITSYYAPFYANFVDGVDGAWGTLVPNNLTNGVNNISQYALSNGALVNACTSANGIYSGVAGNINTANTNTGLSELVLNCTPVGVPSCNVTASASGVNPLCFGAATGSVNLTVTGAAAPVSYAWSNGATTEDLSGVGAGTYTVTVTDANNCTATASATLTAPTELIASSSVTTAIACNGGQAVVTVSATGGTAPYTGVGTFNRTAGTYTFTVTDANGCTATTNVTVSQPTAVVASAQVTTAIACNGGQAVVTVSATGGTAPYTGVGTFNRTAGTYSFTVTDANGCTATANVTVSQPTAVVASAQVTTPVACSGAQAVVTVSATGGTAPYTGVGTFNRTAGTYSFTVTDANGCTATTSVTVSQPSALVASAQVTTPVACNGGQAVVNVSVGGGTAPYTGTGTFNRTAGTYSFTVTDANGCTATTSVTVTEPTALVVSAQVTTPVACNGGQAVVSVSATGGTSPYTGVGTFNRAAGTYSFTVTDANGCTATSSVTVSEPAVLVANATAGTISVPGGTTTVQVTATGGTAPYSGTGSFVRAAGTYTFTVTDANGCSDDITITIVDGIQPLAASSQVTTAIACNGGTGVITVSATGGTAPYSGTGTFIRAAGTYTFTVTDANSNTASTTITISEPTAVVASAQVTTPVACNGGQAVVTVSATGGTAPYTGVGTFNRTAGTYSFTVTDANGCTATANVTVSQPSTLVASAQVTTPVACNGGQAVVTVSATGGTAPYASVGTFPRTAGTYSFDITDANGCTASASVTVSEPAVLVANATAGTISVPGGTTTVQVTATGGTAPYSGTGSFVRAAGTYTFTVTDANGCTDDVTITIVDGIQPLAASSQVTSAIACNGGTGVITVSATGGTAPYSGTGTFIRTAGTYTFTVTDANSNTASTTITISEPTAVVASAQVTTPVACNGGEAVITVSATGGTAPYTGVGSANRTAGTYSFTVIDANGCSATTTVTVSEPAVLVANATAGTISVPGGTTTVQVTATGGTAPYSGTGSFVRAAGTYTFTVTDANGCSDDVTITVVEDGGCNVTVSNIEGPATVCAYVGASGLIASYTVNSTDAAPGYTWTVPAGALNITGQGTNTISFRYPAGFISGTVSVVVTSSCGAPETRTLNVTTVLPGAPVVSGPTNVCQFVGNGQLVTYTAAADVNASGFEWTVPPTVTIVSGQGTNSIQVTIDNGFIANANKLIRVRALSGCGNSNETLYYLLAQFPSTPGPISGPNNVCPFLGTGLQATYTISQVPGASSYIWTAQNGTTVITHPNGLGVNDTTITVSFAGGFTTSSITVAAVNECGASSVRSFTVTRTNPSTPGLISGPTNPCVVTNGLPTYSIVPVPGATSYNWTAPAGATISSVNGPGANDVVVTVDYPAGFTSGQITVTASNACGTSAARILNINRLNPATPGAIDAIQVSTCPNRVYTYSLANLPASATAVNWTAPAGGTIISGQGTNSITVSYIAGAISGNITATAVNNCASSLTRSLAVRLAECPVTPPLPFTKGTEVDITAKDQIQVALYPNPTTNFSMLQVNSSKTEIVRVRILDITGRENKRMNMVAGQSAKIGFDLMPGTYFVEVRQAGQVRVEKLIKL